MSRVRRPLTEGVRTAEHTEDLRSAVGQFEVLLTP